MSAAENDARFWDRAARKYAADPIADMEGYERTLERVRSLVAADHEILEIGCGTGTTALKLAPLVGRIVATDISEKMIAIAREKAAAENVENVHFEVERADADGAPQQDFHAALAFNLLHLIEARAAALHSIHARLKPGGLFISKTPCLKEMGFWLRFALPVMQLFGKAPYVAFFDAGELEREIEAAGFEIVARERHASRGKDVRPFLVARKL